MAFMASGAALFGFGLWCLFLPSGRRTCRHPLRAFSPVLGSAVLFVAVLLLYRAGLDLGFWTRYLP